jgi:hypothetical protein
MVKEIVIKKPNKKETTEIMKPALRSATETGFTT